MKQIFAYECLWAKILTCQLHVVCGHAVGPSWIVSVHACIIKTYIGGKNTVNETIANCSLCEINNHFLCVMMRKIGFA